MPITLDGTNGIDTPDLASTGPISGTTGAFSGNVTANGLTTELRPLVSGTAVASTSGTAIDFTGIPSWAKRVTVMVVGVSLSGTSFPLIQVGTSGGVATTGYSVATMNNSGTGVITTNGIQAMFIGTATAALVISGTITLANVTGNTWVVSGTMGRTDSATQAAGIGGSVALGATLDRVRVTTVNGTDTFDAGTINIMWE